MEKFNRRNRFDHLSPEQAADLARHIWQGFSEFYKELGKLKPGEKLPITSEDYADLYAATGEYDEAVHRAGGIQAVFPEMTDPADPKFIVYGIRSMLDNRTTIVSDNSLNHPIAEA